MMNIKQIKELAQLLKQNDLSALEINEGDLHIRMEREIAERVVYQAEPERFAPMATAPVMAAPAHIPTDPGLDFNNLKIVNSPLVGVFYAAPAPDAAPFVKVGDRVKVGDVLCIVEAMKLMNEIVAEFDGEIVDICATNGDVVEFGQALFKLN